MEWTPFILIAWSPGEGCLGKGMTWARQLFAKLRQTLKVLTAGDYLHYLLWLVDMEKYSLPLKEGLAQVAVSNQPL